MARLYKNGAELERLERIVETRDELGKVVSNYKVQYSVRSNGWVLRKSGDHWTRFRKVSDVGKSGLNTVDFLRSIGAKPTN